MDDTTQTTKDRSDECKNSNTATIAGWTAGTTAFFVMVALINAPTWPVAFGVSVMMLTVAMVCCCILKKG